MQRTCALVVAGLLLSCPLAELAGAQPTTGRHRADRTDRQEEATVEGYDERNGRWALIASAGALAGGDLVRVRTGGSAGIPWDPPGGPEFRSDSFQLTLDESIAVNLGLARRLGERVWLRLGVTAAQLDVAAQARVGQTAEVFRWDQLAVLIAGLDAEYRLVRAPSYFFLATGLSVLRLAGDGDDGLDDTALALRLGAGFHQHLAPGWGLRLEVRDNLAGLDHDGYRPPVVGDTVYPDITLDDAGTDHFWELLVSMQTVF